MKIVREFGDAFLPIELSMLMEVKYSLISSLPNILIDGLCFLKERFTLSIILNSLANYINLFHQLTLDCFSRFLLFTYFGELLDFIWHLNWDRSLAVLSAKGSYLHHFRYFFCFLMSLYSLQTWEPVSLTNKTSLNYLTLFVILWTFVARCQTLFLSENIIFSIHYSICIYCFHLLDLSIICPFTHGSLFP